MNAWRGAETNVIDAAEKLVLPGFNDAHVHFLDGSRELTNVSLKDAKTPEEFARRIAEHASKLGKGEWVLGGNWDDQAFTTPRLPTRQDVDALTTNTGVFVTRYDGHMSLANSYVLKLAGITANTPDPPGGTIVRDAQGNPTGILKDAAMDPVYKVMPKMSHDRLLDVMRQGVKYTASVGVTSV